MDYEIVRLIQSIRNPFFDWFFYIVTQLGDQYVFILVAVILYWTVDKKFAHKFVFAFIISAAVNSSLKEMFKRVRPFYLSGIESEAHWQTDGYSFPSGHAQAAGVLGYTGLAAYKRYGFKFLRYISLFIMIFVPISRIYLGQHYLTDVLVGLLLAYGIAALMFKLVDRMKNEEDIYTLMLVPIFFILMIFIKNHDLYIAAGGFTGFALGYYLEKRYIKYDVKDKMLYQIIKVIFGIIIALAIKEGFKLIVPDTIFFDFIRYGLIGLWAALGAPWVFNYGKRYFK